MNDAGPRDKDSEQMAYQDQKRLAHDGEASGFRELSRKHIGVAGLACTSHRVNSPVGQVESANLMVVRIGDVEHIRMPDAA